MSPRAADPRIKSAGRGRHQHRCRRREHDGCDDQKGLLRGVSTFNPLNEYAHSVSSSTSSPGIAGTRDLLS